MELRPIGFGDDIDGGVVNDGAELDVKKAVGGGQLLGFRERVGEALHIDANHGSGVIAGGLGCERGAGAADLFAILADSKGGGLRHGCGRSAEKN